MLHFWRNKTMKKVVENEYVWSGKAVIVIGFRVEITSSLNLFPARWVARFRYSLLSFEDFLRETFARDYLSQFWVSVLFTANRFSTEVVRPVIPFPLMDSRIGGTNDPFLVYLYVICDGLGYVLYVLPLSHALWLTSCSREAVVCSETRGDFHWKEEKNVFAQLANCAIPNSSSRYSWAKPCLPVKSHFPCKIKWVNI